MATYVKGAAVANAETYELLEKKSGAYTSLATAGNINFNLSKIALSAGEHTLVVKAKATGYADSDYSNEVVYSTDTATDGNLLDLTKARFDIRYSPASNKIVNASQTKYALVVAELEANATYALTVDSVPTGALYADTPVLNAVAAENVTWIGNGTTTFTTGESALYLALNVSTVNISDGTDTDTTITDAWKAATLYRVG